MKKILIGLCAFALVIMVTACGKTGIVGTYEMVEMTAFGQTITGEDLEELGVKYELIVNEDKTAVLKVGEEEQQLTYDDKTFSGKDEETGEEEAIPYTLSGSKITMEDEGIKMVFEKK